MSNADTSPHRSRTAWTVPLARGGSGSPYYQLGGVSYAAVLVFLRFRG